MINTSGLKLKKYLFSFKHEGSEWAFEVHAEDEEDARLRVSKMSNATYDGELAMKIPAQFGLFSRLIVILMNSASAIKRALTN